MEIETQVITNPLLDLMKQIEDDPEPDLGSKVILHNDDITPAIFVVDVLKKFFDLPHTRSFALMQTAHSFGQCIIGTWETERAVSLVQQANEYAAQNLYPLKFTHEEA